MPLVALAWNLFHGRDFPPDPGLLTWRSRLLRREERNATHVQVNRELLPEFAELLAGARWDVALLQECPPRWAEPLAAACQAEAHRVLTSRNSLGALRGAAARLNPDLIASNEGGSNLTLVRPPPPRCELSVPSTDNSHREPGGRGPGGRGPGGRGPGGAAIAERREVTIHDGRPERRAMALTLVRGAMLGDAPDLCLANLHASANDPALAAADVLRAAAAATAWAAGRPLLFGGDLNLRPGESPAIFEQLRERFGLDGPTGPRAIDHLLSARLEAGCPAGAWPPERRELRRGGLGLRLSDHAPVQGEFRPFRIR